jgi:hypothetical protein
MLITKTTIAAGDIVTFKLVTTEEIIAKVVSLNDTTVTIEKPLLLQLSMDQASGQPSVQMLPFWVLSAETPKLDLQKSHIMVMALSNDGAKKGYLQNTSGLIIPPANGLTL